MHGHWEGPVVRSVLDVPSTTIFRKPKFRLHSTIASWASQAFDSQLIQPMPVILSPGPIAKNESTVTQESQEGQQEPSDNTNPEILRDHQPTGLWIEDKQVHPVQAL